MQQATITVTPKADRDDVGGFQALSPLRIDGEQQVTISVEGDDDDTAGHLIFLLALGAVAVLSACETNNHVTINGSHNTVNPTGTSTSTTATTSVGGGRR